MIRVLASGTLHAEPVQRTGASGKTFTTAKLRADDGKGGAVWCNLIAFGETGARLATLKAGAALAVAGRAEMTAWLDKQGEPKSGLSLVADELAALRGKPKPKPDAPRPQTDPAPLDDLDRWPP